MMTPTLLLSHLNIVSLYGRMETLIRTAQASQEVRFKILISVVSSPVFLFFIFKYFKDDFLEELNTFFI